MALRALFRISRGGAVRRLAVAAPRVEPVANGIQSLRGPSSESFLKSSQLLRDSLVMDATVQRIGFSSSASPQPSNKETSQSAGDNFQEALEDARPEGSSDPNSDADEMAQDKDAESDLSREDLVKLVAENKELLKLKDKEIANMKDKLLRSYAEMENVIDRTKRDAENSKKFAIQNFAKNLLDVADNLTRASSVVKESFSKINSSNDSAGAVPLLKTLLEGVEMTEKQLAEVFRKFGVEKFDPLDEQFDPNRHNAVFQVPDTTKPPGTVAVVLKSGYMLYDRVLRPAEVGVTQASDGESSNNGSEKSSE